MSAAGARADGALVVCENLVKIYKVADLEVVALQGLDLRVEGGEVIAIVGASGSGKSTLQNILGGIDTPTAGQAVVAGHDLTSMRARERTDYRRRVVGFVWQQTSRNLLPYLDVQQNVELPMLLEGLPGARDGWRAPRPPRLVEHVRRGARPAGAPLGRRAAAGRPRRRARQRARAPARGRADGRARQPDCGRAVRAAPRGRTSELGVTVIVLTHDPLVSGEVAAHRARSATGARAPRRSAGGRPTGSRWSRRSSPSSTASAGSSSPASTSPRSSSSAASGSRSSRTTSASGRTARRTGEAARRARKTRRRRVTD